MNVFEDGAHELETLVRLASLGDERAWSKIVDRFQSLVFSVPRRMGLSPDDAHDVFIVTFTALSKSLDRIENASTLPKWLSVTASRESYRLLRSRKTALAGDINLSLDDVLADEDRTVDDQLALTELGEGLRQAMLALSERCRELLTALYLDAEASYQEISEQMQLPLGSIGPTKARCLEKLRTISLKAGFFEGMY